MAQRKKKVKKIITKKIVFRLSIRQKRILDRYCKAHNLSNNKLIKLALKDYMLRNFDLPDEQIISKNQLNIFDLIDEEDAYDNEAAESQELYKD